MPLYDKINLHPATRPPSALASDTYDVICIGTGWAGTISAGRIVKAGMTALVVEAELFGGECPFWACKPSKALLRPGEALDEARAVSGLQENMNEVTSLDMKGVFKRRDYFTQNWNDETNIAPALESQGIALVRGRGEFVGTKQVRVVGNDGDSRLFHARHAVVICTGSVPIIPDILGLAEAKPWTAREVTSTSEVPRHLIVLGSGAVGCEMVSAYVSFGAQVTLVSSSAEILSSTDHEAGALVRERFVRQGVDVFLSAKVLSVQRKADGDVVVDLGDKGSIEASEILIATGRKGQFEGLGLDRLGLHVNGRWIDVDDSLRVKSVEGSWLYAAGDVNGRATFTHSSKYHARVVANAILAQAKGSLHSENTPSGCVALADLYAVPRVVFTQPTVAGIGLTRSMAQKSGRKYREITAPVKTHGAELRTEGYEDGWAQWIVDEESGKLVGATFVGDGVADLLHASTVAVVGGMTLAQLAHAVPSFPTMSEVYLNLLEAAGL